MSVARFKAAVESKDIDAMLACLDDDVVFRSPAVFKPYTGKEAVGRLLATVAQVFEDFHYTAQVNESDRAVLIFEARVGDRKLEGVDVLHFGSGGLIREFVVMVRPMSGLMALAQEMGARLGVAG